MARTTFALGLVAMLAATGCRMGLHPYDNCGPVWSGGACQTCNPNYRAGSILSGGPLLGGGALMGGQAMHTGSAMAGNAAMPTRGSRAKMPGMISDSDYAAEAVPTPAPTRAMRPMAKKAAPAAQPRDFALPTPPVATGAAKNNQRPAPAGTREGTTKVLSVQDRKADENMPALSGDAAPGASDDPIPQAPEQPIMSADPPRQPQPSRQTRATRSMARRLQLNVW